MSFSLTTRQIRSRSKDVTRRLGWSDLKPGDRVCAVVKAMGLKKGEKLKRIRVIECVSNRPEPLSRMLKGDGYGMAECIREGFPMMTSAEFVAMFCEHMRCTPRKRVNRIEFKYVT